MVLAQLASPATSAYPPLVVVESIHVFLVHVVHDGCVRNTCFIVCFGFGRATVRWAGMRQNVSLLTLHDMVRAKEFFLGGLGGTLPSAGERQSYDL